MHKSDPLARALGKMALGLKGERERAGSPLGPLARKREMGDGTQRGSYKSAWGGERTVDLVVHQKKKKGNFGECDEGEERLNTSRDAGSYSGQRWQINKDLRTKRLNKVGGTLQTRPKLCLKQNEGKWKDKKTKAALQIRL